MSVKIVVLVCLVAAAGQVSSLGTSKFRDGLVQVGRFFEKVKESQDLILLNLKGTVGLDPIKCAQDTGEMATSQFQRCQTVFADFSNPSNINATSARRFCDSHCPQYLVGLLGRLVRDCGLPSSQLPDEAVMTLLNKTCAMTNNHYCIEEWVNIDADSLDPSYATCLAHFSGHGSCPNVCKEAERWIVNNLGCCYRVLVDFLVSQGEASAGFFLEDYWHACGVKEPKTCSNPR